MTEPTGKRRRTTAAGPVSPRSEVPGPDLTSHEIVGILDASDGEAHVENKVSSQKASSQKGDSAGRASHPRFDELERPSDVLLLGPIGSRGPRLKSRSAKPAPIRCATRSPVPVEGPGSGRASSARPFTSPWEEAGVRYGARIRVHAPSRFGVLVELGGEFDVSCSDAFDQALRGLEPTGPAYVDLSAVTFMDAHCVRRLADGVRAGLLRLCRPSAEVRLSVAACNLDGYLDIRPDDDRGYEEVIREASKCQDGQPEERKGHRLYFKAYHCSGGENTLAGREL